MSGPKRAQHHRFGAKAQDAIAGPAIILVEPQMGENIGAACRAMWNFGLDGSAPCRSARRLAEPRRRVAMASGASRVLGGGRRFIETTAEAVAEISPCSTPPRRGARELTKRSPHSGRSGGAGDCRRKSPGWRGMPCGVLFGRERTGLENDDVDPPPTPSSPCPPTPSFSLAQPRPMRAAARVRTAQAPGRNGGAGERHGQDGDGPAGGCRRALCAP